MRSLPDAVKILLDHVANIFLQFVGVRQKRFEIGIELCVSLIQIVICFIHHYRFGVVEVLHGFFKGCKKKIICAQDRLVCTVAQKKSFHPSLEQAVVVVDQIEHRYDFAEAFAERVEFSEDVVFGEVERLLTRKEGLVFYQSVGLSVDLVEDDALSQLVFDHGSVLRPNGFLAATGHVFLASFNHLVRDLKQEVAIEDHWTTLDSP